MRFFKASAKYASTRAKDLSFLNCMFVLYRTTIKLGFIEEDQQNYK